MCVFVSQKLAIKYHPDKNAGDKKAEAEEKFKEVGKAFDTLKDPEKRRIYDQVGEEGLNGGMPTSESAGGPSFRYSGSTMPGQSGQTFHFTSADPNDVFRQFFGTDDPFEADREDGFPGFTFPGMRSHFGGASMNMPRGGMRHSSNKPFQQQQKPEQLHHTLSIPLESIYSGTVKKVRITKKILDASGQHLSISKDLEINVKPGWKDGTKITFEKEGDEVQPGVAQDVVFEIKAKPHDKFTRDNDDLIFTHDVDLVDAIEGSFTFTLTTLDNRELQVIETNFSPNRVKIMSGEGMPNNKKRTRGDLRIKYNIIFPELSKSERHEIATILRNSSSHRSKRK